MNQYIEMRNRHQEEFNTLPMKAAFGEAQFKEMMHEWGLQNGKKSLEKIVHIAGGVYMLKKDLHLYHEMSERHYREMKDAIASDTTGKGFIYDMFRAELSNHEYTYTYDVSDAIAACGVTVEEINADQRLAHGLWKATQDLKRWAEEHDW